MKVIEKIPTMSDLELSRLFANVMDFIEKKKQVDTALEVKRAIQTEWAKRLAAFNQGAYKAETPETGVLKTIGYKVGIDGLPESKRRLLIDYLISETLPPVGSPAHMAEWGEPLTKLRYQKAHRVIQVLMSSAKTLGYMDKAAREWEEDLKYMESTWQHLKQN
jgi:hypothetical protein